MKKAPRVIWFLEIEIVIQGSHGILAGGARTIQLGSEFASKKLDKGKQPDLRFLSHQQSLPSPPYWLNHVTSQRLWKLFWPEGGRGSWWVSAANSVETISL